MLRPLLPPGYQMEIVRDEGEFIRNAVDAVKEAGVIAQVGTQIRSLPGIVGARDETLNAIAVRIRFGNAEAARDR